MFPCHISYFEIYQLSSFISVFEAKTGAKDNKPFAISHVSFISQDQTTLADGDHSLLVYSVCATFIHVQVSYLLLGPFESTAVV